MPTFDFSEKQKGKFSIIPTGIYDAVVERIEERTARSGNKYKHITFRIFGEKAEREKVNGRLVWDNIVLLKQVEWKIQGLLYACKLSYEGSVKLSDDWKELIGKELKIGIGKREFNGTEQNEVNNFYPLTTEVISRTKPSSKPRTEEISEKDKKEEIPIIEEDGGIDVKDIPF